MKDIITAYGMTECVTITSCLPGDPADLIAHSCGAPIPGNDVRIVGKTGRKWHAARRVRLSCADKA
ncbi:AMP-binding protein [Novosphingobium panipatense]|uniref:AMP-binding protein n=1 Tax=Novosphingobium panipatense TaxID=428991 RepID=UPI00361F8BAF